MINMSLHCKRNDLEVKAKTEGEGLTLSLRASGLLEREGSRLALFLSREQARGIYDKIGQALDNVTEGEEAA